MNVNYFKGQMISNLFLVIFIFVITLSRVNAQIEYQDVKEFNTLYSFENIAFKWKGDAKIQPLLNNGINSLNEKKIGEAIGNFDELLNINPNFQVALYYRGICYKLQNDFIKAKADFTKLIELRGDLPQAYLEISKVKILVGFNSEAIQFLTTCIQKFPSYVSAYYLMGESYLRTKEVQKAKLYFDSCQIIAPEFLPAKVKLGLIEIGVNKDAQTGLKLFNEVIQIDSLQKEALWCRASICYRFDSKKRIRDLNTLVRHSPTNFYFLLLRGLTLLELGNADGAWADFKIISSIPIAEQSNTSETILRFTKIQNLRNYLARNIYALSEKDQYIYKEGFCLIVAGGYQVAIKKLNNAKFKKNASWHYLLGIANQSIGLHQEAQQHYISALSFDNDIFDAHQFRGLYLLQFNNSNAINHFDEMIRINPDNKSGYALRSVANYKLKDYTRSIDDADKVLKIDSLDCDIRRVMGSAYLAEDKILTAFETFIPCHDLEIHKLDLAKFHNSVTDLLKTGDTTKVLFYLNKMTDIRPLYEYGTRLKIDILFAQKKWMELQLFLKERVKRFATLNSKEYKDHINEELVLVENILKETTSNKKEKG